MHRKQYNNVIEWTLEHDESAKTGDSLATARAICNNLGVPLPQGDCKDVLNALEAGDYMGWTSCSAEEAQAAANDGVATIAVSDSQVNVLTAEEDDGAEKNAGDYFPASLSSNDYTYVDSSTYQYYSYSSATTIKSKAIIIVPGIMGTELELITAADGFEAGTQLWPPYDSDATIALNKLKALRCSDTGHSVNLVKVKNTNNYGANNTYRELYNYLSTAFGNAYDVLFYGYDWRESNSYSASGLRNLVNRYESAIIVAHSMGGLVASHMLTSQYIWDKVEKIITIGTPFLGALEILPTLTHGEHEIIDDFLGGGIWGNIIGNVFVEPEIRNLVSNFLSVYELLPNERFFDLDGRWWYKEYGQLPYEAAIGEQIFESYEDTYGRLAEIVDEYNSDLYNLAVERNARLWNNNTHITSNVESYYIVGEGQSTARYYRYNSITGGYSLENTNAGDGSVLTYSASMEDMYPSKSFFATATHNDLVKSNSNPDVLKLIKNIINNNSTLPSGIRSNPANGI